MNDSSASKESAVTDEVKVTIEYHGRTYTSVRKATLACIMVNPETMMDQAVLGAYWCMRDAIEFHKKGQS